MKFQIVSLWFQNKGLTQAVQLLTFQTWLIKTFLKCKKISEKQWYRHSITVSCASTSDLLIAHVFSLVIFQEKVGKRLLPCL